MSGLPVANRGFFIPDQTLHWSEGKLTVRAGGGIIMFHIEDEDDLDWYVEILRRECSLRSTYLCRWINGRFTIVEADYGPLPWKVRCYVAHTLLNIPQTKFVGYALKLLQDAPPPSTGDIP